MKLEPVFAARSLRRRLRRTVRMSSRASLTIRSLCPQIRQPEYTLDPLNLDALLPLGVADYTYVLSSPASSSSADASPACEPTTTSPPPPHPRRVSLGKGKFSEVLLVRKGTVEVSFFVGGRLGARLLRR